MMKLLPILLGLGLLGPQATPAQSVAVVYRCPGPPVLYTDALSAEEARARGCRTIDGAPITIIQNTRPRPPAAASGGAGAAPGAGAGSGPARQEARVDPGQQKLRDNDARRILEAELRREQAHLDQLKRDYHNGEPERRGDERNYQRYLERVAEMKSSIARTEADIAAIRRELAKLGAP